MASETEVKIRAAVTKALNTSAAFNRKLKNPFRKHMFLTGIHEPMVEELSLDHLEVSGEIPEALVGTYARIGPNPFKPDQAGPAPLNFQCFFKLLISAAFIRVEDEMYL